MIYFIISIEVHSSEIDVGTSLKNKKHECIIRVNEKEGICMRYIRSRRRRQRQRSINKTLKSRALIQFSFYNHRTKKKHLGPGFPVISSARSLHLIRKEWKNLIACVLEWNSILVPDAYALDDRVTQLSTTLCGLR